MTQPTAHVGHPSRPTCVSFVGEGEWGTSTNLLIAVCCIISNKVLCL